MRRAAEAYLQHANERAASTDVTVPRSGLTRIGVSDPTSGAEWPHSGHSPLVSQPGVVAPFVVAAVGLALGAYGPNATALLVAFIGSVLVVIAAIDFERRVIPNQIVYPSTVIILLGRIVLTPGHAVEYVLAALFAGVFLMLPRIVRADAVGMGDVKLAILIGAALGWEATSALAVAFLCVFPVAVVMIVGGGLTARRKMIPFGPFLALGALVTLLGPRLVSG